MQPPTNQTLNLRIGRKIAEIEVLTEKAMEHFNQSSSEGLLFLEKAIDRLEDGPVTKKDANHIKYNLRYVEMYLLQIKKLSS